MISRPEFHGHRQGLLTNSRISSPGKHSDLLLRPTNQLRQIHWEQLPLLKINLSGPFAASVKSFHSSTQVSALLIKGDSSPAKCSLTLQEAITANFLFCFVSVLCDVYWNHSVIPRWMLIVLEGPRQLHSNAWDLGRNSQQSGFQLSPFLSRQL